MSSNEFVEEVYSFPEDTTILDQYIDKKNALSSKSSDWKIIKTLYQPAAAFAFGSLFAIRVLTPLGAVARRMKEQKQGKGVYYLNRIIPLVSYAYCAWWFRNAQYRPNPYSTGELP